ncbi:hypothetical protein [Bradyrhizobium sp. RT5a]|uniref:hypothetical protein n=1 Tax=Bradyrhizobium sp. RT5a TaxID=3156380 RepID=UPI003398FC5D
MMNEDSFLQKNYEYYQAWHHWLGKANKLKRAALILYRADLPDLKLYDEAYHRALEQLEGREGTAAVRHPHPDMLPAFSLFGSALESIFKGVMVNNDPNLIGEHKLSQNLKSHDLVQLAADAEIALDDRESRLLVWVSEVVIWKARYSVPTNTKFGDAFFHQLDNISLSNAETCITLLEGIFERARSTLPPALQRATEGFDVLVSWKE